jgi:hypothetical protein
VLPTWAPVDEDGELLPEAEAAAQQAEWDQNDARGEPTDELRAFAPCRGGEAVAGSSG